jgi:hypothetical protein
MDFSGSIQMSIFAYVLMAIVAMLAPVMVKGIVILLRQAGRKRASAAATPVNISVVAAVDETAAQVAAVAAAVYAVLGAHRLVRIGESAPTPTWVTAGRAAHHLSHAPRRTGR